MGGFFCFLVPGKVWVTKLGNCLRKSVLSCLVFDASLWDFVRRDRISDGGDMIAQICGFGCASTLFGGRKFTGEGSSQLCRSCDFTERVDSPEWRRAPVEARDTQRELCGDPPVRRGSRIDLHLGNV